jgi:hypothetical protein
MVRERRLSPTFLIPMLLYGASVGSGIYQTFWANEWIAVLLAAAAVFATWAYVIYRRSTR